MTLEQLNFLSKEGSGTVRQKNAVQPLLWACLFVTVPCFYLCTQVEPRMQPWIFGAGCVPLLLLAAGYLWFMFKDPSRLQSEEYQLRSRVLDIIETKGGRFQVEPANMQLILNPEAKRLSGQEEDAT